jgi:hypothetical protein
MKIKIQKKVNKDLLADQIRDNVPGLFFVTTLGKTATNMRVVTEGNNTFVDTPDEFYDEVIAIIKSHDAGQESKNEKENKEIDSIPAWLRKASYQEISDRIDAGVGVTESRALKLINKAENLDEIKLVLKNVVSIIFFIIEIQKNIIKIITRIR